MTLPKSMAVLYKFIDIGANLVDPMFQGIYNGNKKHDCDLKSVLDRSFKAGLDKIIITGTNKADVMKALDICRENDRIFTTVGCHPTNCNEFEDDPEQYLQDLEMLKQNNKNKIIALGEFGLDYDRLHFCPIEVQKKYFEYQIKLNENHKLPLFVHCRNAVDDVIKILSKHRDAYDGGVIHSFDSTWDDAKKVLDLGMYIGLNGCSLKTQENLDVVAKLPIDRILIETDSPWCEIRPTHASYKYIQTKYPSKKKEKWESTSFVKGRNEPANIIQVLEVIAAVQNIDPIDVCQTIYDSSNSLFFNKI